MQPVPCIARFIRADVTRRRYTRGTNRFTGARLVFTTKGGKVQAKNRNYRAIDVDCVAQTAVPTLGLTANLSGVTLAWRRAAIVAIRHVRRNTLGAEALLFRETGKETGYCWFQNARFKQDKTTKSADVLACSTDLKKVPESVEDRHLPRTRIGCRSTRM